MAPNTKVSNWFQKAIYHILFIVYTYYTYIFINAYFNVATEQKSGFKKAIWSYDFMCMSFDVTFFREL